MNINFLLFVCILILRRFLFVQWQNSFKYHKKITRWHTSRSSSENNWSHIALTTIHRDINNKQKQKCQHRNKYKTQTEGNKRRKKMWKKLFIIYLMHISLETVDNDNETVGSVDWLLGRFSNCSSFDVSRLLIAHMFSNTISVSFHFFTIIFQQQYQ